MNCIPTDEDLTILIEEISKPKVQRHVRFASNNTVHVTSAIDNNTEEQWYQKDEIASFKLYIQNLTASLIRGEKLKVDTTETFRGLEHYCDLNRLKRKQNVISFILKAQMLAKGSQLASIAHDCTSWHRDISFVQGLHDKRTGSWDHGNSSLTVDNSQFDCNVKTFPVQGGLLDILTDLLGRQTKRSELGR